MIRKTAFFLLAFFSLSIFSFAQYVPSNDEYSLRMNAQTKSDKKKKKKKIPYEMPVNASDLIFFMPAGNDAWTLSLTSSGGFAGVTRLIAAVNSNGNYLCSTGEDFRNRLLEKPVLDEIFDFVETSNFTKFGDTESKNVDYCMDCAYTRLTLQTRNGFVSRTLNDYANETAAIRQIYDRLNDLQECR